MGIPISELKTFAQAVLVAAGANKDDARQLAEILLWADTVGRTEQGVERLPILCQRLEKELIQSPAPFTWSNLEAAICHLDARGGFGHLAAQAATHKAIEMAKRFGIGAVTVSNSNYFGAAGYYPWLISQQNMVGIALSNSFPKVAAYGGINPVLGTNPLAFAAPITNDYPLVVDMATAAVAGSEIRRRKSAGLPLDPGMAVDKQGNPLLDPEQFGTGAALPFGGSRGFGIMLLVEILSGVLSGASIAKDVKSMYGDWSHSGENGHFFLALNPETFLPQGNFADRMLILKDMIIGSGSNVRLPGAMRWKFLEQSKLQGILPANIPVTALIELGQRFGISTTIFTPGE